MDVQNEENCVRDEAHDVAERATPDLRVAIRKTHRLNHDPEKQINT